MPNPEARCSSSVKQAEIVGRANRPKSVDAETGQKPSRRYSGLRKKQVGKEQNEVRDCVSLRLRKGSTHPCLAYAEILLTLVV